MSRAVPRGGRAHRSIPLVRATALAAVIASAGALAGCGTTVIETTESTLAPGETTTTVPLPATTTARIEQIVTLARGLGDLIVDGGDRDVIARIDALWAASSAEVGDDDPDLGREIEQQLALLHAGVERNRPADADKASRNLATVLRAYLERHTDG